MGNNARDFDNCCKYRPSKSFAETLNIVYKYHINIQGVLL